ncbi:MAG: 7-cyano-7-deazaguanine synthase QueC [Alphaproteobacteria bacterium]|nr:7-cyano-7-deazaguanine synthase QueC [Alphaproteobacteria bacterium]
MTRESALVLFSGGQDSTVCLAWALARFERVETIGFDYGQRHRIELAQRPKVRERILADLPELADRLGEDHVVDLSGLGSISDTALTREREIDFHENGLPSTFVPGRNLVFLTFAAALAYRRGLSRLVGGMCETDFSGYPDCRRQTIDAMEQALTLGLERATPIDTPLMRMTKAATWRLAEDLGGETLVRLIVEETHTCYLGERGRLHSWGYGCGGCPACQLRSRGWDEYVSGRFA